MTASAFDGYAECEVWVGVLCSYGCEAVRGAGSDGDEHVFAGVVFTRVCDCSGMS